jgi:hypothetical protein
MKVETGLVVGKGLGDVVADFSVIARSIVSGAKRSRTMRRSNLQIANRRLLRTKIASQ